MVFKPASYFSMPHYPVNPPVLKLGLSVDFFN
ncbi:MAG: putative porin [Dysgonamonadaceae bacterium]|nr:putative porin [Dysgonamonadaceae bacterium]